MQNIYSAKSALKIEKVKLTLLATKHMLNVNVWERIKLLTRSTVFRQKAIFSPHVLNDLELKREMDCVPAVVSCIHVDHPTVLLYLLPAVQSTTYKC